MTKDARQRVPPRAKAETGYSGGRLRRPLSGILRGCGRQKPTLVCIFSPQGDTWDEIRSGNAAQVLLYPLRSKKLRSLACRQTQKESERASERAMYGNGTAARPQRPSGDWIGGFFLPHRRLSIVINQRCVLRVRHVFFFFPTAGSKLSIS